MEGASRVAAFGVAVLSVVATLATHAAAQSVAEPAVQMPSQATIPDAFAGTWDYNPTESINIATGRPEQAPRSATQGGVAPTAPAGRPAGAGGGGGGGFGGGRGGGRGGDLGIGPSPAMMREARDMSRDLLEVPEALTIALTGTTVSFVDDIARERVYPLDGSRNKYRLGASEFNARVQWTGTQLRKDIEGSFGFKMSEVYYLSADSQRLFVIIRLLTGGQTRQPQGVNRVYDRLPGPAPAGETDRTARQ